MLLRATLHQWRGRIGLCIVVILVLMAVLGPLIAPHSPTAFVAAPNSPPVRQVLFGADCLGRDVWSRFLHGGLQRARAVAGLDDRRRRRRPVRRTDRPPTAAASVDEILMRIADVFMAFPQIVLALLLVTAFGPKVWLIVLTVGISHAPRVARVIRGAAPGGRARLRQGRRGGRRAAPADHLR